MHKLNEINLEELTTQKLEILQVELQEFLNSPLYQVFIQACFTLKVSLVDSALKADLKGVESLFLREQLFGESVGWENMQTLFSDMLAEVTELLNKKNKPTPQHV